MGKLWRISSSERALCQILAMQITIRDNGEVNNKAAHLRLGVQADGQRDLLGL